ncbi:hypothetical protein HK101_003642, partial [Irineochytrium annulatum]
DHSLKLPAMGQVDDYKKNIGFQGGISFLISSITGPGIILLPSLFQSAGWFFPLITLFIVSILTGLSGLFLVEAMTYFPGNAYFERNVEFTVLVHHFYGKKWYYLMHIVLYGSLQSFNIASIVAAVQAFDQVLVGVFGTTCGFEVYPNSNIICSSAASEPWGDSFMLITAGGLVFGALIIPLMNLNLDDNMILQWVSLLYMCLAVFCWAMMSFAHGVNANLLPAFGPQVTSSPTAVIGQIMFNFTLANTIPSWVNTKHPKVSIHKCIWTAIWTTAAIYVVTGTTVAASFTVDTDLFTAMLASNMPSGLLTLLQIINFTFPILAYLTSIPVSFIIIKLNLITSRLCSRDVATFWATIFPFLICIPLQTGPYLVEFTNWSSLFFQTCCNFVAPFMIYIFLDKRNLIMQQSVIDELENLDLDGAVRKRNTDDDDFDYVYHLPHADLTKIPPRKWDPFAKYAIKDPSKAAGSEQGAQPAIKVPDIAKDESTASMHSRRDKTASRLLNLGGAPQPDLRKSLHSHLVVGGGAAAGNAGGGGSANNLAVQGGMGGLGGSSVQLGVPGGGGMFRRGSFMAGSTNALAGPPSAMPTNGGMSRRGSNISARGFASGSPSNSPLGQQQQDRESRFEIGKLMDKADTQMGGYVVSGGVGQQGPGGANMVRRQSMASYHSKKIHPSGDDLDRMGEARTEETLDQNGEAVLDMDGMAPVFRALPEWVTKRVSSRTVAIFCFTLTLVLALSVLMYDFVELGMGNDVVGKAGASSSSSKTDVAGVIGSVVPSAAVTAI